MNRDLRSLSLDLRSFRVSRGVFALIALATGVALGPDGASGVGVACIAVGLVGATCALRPGSRHPRRSAGRRDVRRELGPELMALEVRGWLVSESVPAGGQGEIDFLVTTPAVSFVVDVAEGGRERAAAARLGRQVAWARERYGPGRQIEPVLWGEAPLGTGRPAVGARRIQPSRLVSFLLDRG